MQYRAYSTVYTVHTVQSLSYSTLNNIKLYITLSIEFIVQYMQYRPYRIIQTLSYNTLNNIKLYITFSTVYVVQSL